jgi:HAD superfamily hydrolase (TIGR01549 family)
VIFDLDGTLLTLPVDWEAVKRSLRDYFKSEDAFLPLFKTVEAKMTQRPEARSKVFSLIDDYEVAAAKRSRLLPGVLALFSHLAGRSKVTVVTMQGRRVCSQLLEMHGLARFIEFSLTREDSLDRSVQLEIALKRLSLSPRDALFVGDRMNDVNAAKQVKVAVVLVGRRKVEDSIKVTQFETIIGLKDYLSKSPR